MSPNIFDFRTTPKGAEEATIRQKTLLLDGHSLAFRAFYALPPDLRTTSGQQTNAVFGFTSMLIKAMQDEKTSHIAVAFDKGPPIERIAIRPEYKAQRTAPPDEFTQQMGLITEVLKVLRIPVFSIDNIEADDIIAVLAKRLVAAGHDVVVVTADRDFFQIVGPHIQVMMNRRGISETVVYDEKAVIERFGFPPERYLEYAALRGDPSDNIEGVPGVGEKTAAKLVQAHATLEEIFEHADELTPRVRTNLEAARERLLENREFFRFRSEEELGPAAQAVVEGLTEADLRIGDWDLSEIRRLFDALEFRTLYERLIAEAPEPPAGDGFEVEWEEVLDSASLQRIADQIADGRSVTIRVSGNLALPRQLPNAIAFSFAEGQPVFLLRVGRALSSEKIAFVLGPSLARARVTTHQAKDALLGLAALGIPINSPDGVDMKVVMDTEIAAYLVDPARGRYELVDLTRQFLSRDLTLRAAEPETDGQQSLLVDQNDQDSNSPALEAAAIAELAIVLEKELIEKGERELMATLELPLTAVLAKVESAGVKIDVDYLRKMGESMAKQLKEIEEEIFTHSGGPFNISSPPQLRTVLYEKLGLKPSKKTKTGFSTDASVLESLREEHPIVDAILRYRERSKLRSTYVEALPPLVDPITKRLHCRFNQATTSTGRLSSDSPNLQNIPIRTAEGKQIRRAFITEQGHLLVVADYSQIEFRVLAHMSGDQELINAFSRGEDIHRRSIAKALGIPEDEITPELRSIGKMVSFGVTYGMGAFGLSQRLRIPVDQARTYIEGFYALYPRVREYLDEVVARATVDGFTKTLFGRRRYLPELHSKNPRVRGLGERMALNAPIQGTAADIMKLAMLSTDKALRGSGARMVLTVHDELVFEVPEDEVDPVSALVRTSMEGAADLDIPLQVEVSSGNNWADAKG